MLLAARWISEAARALRARTASYWNAPQQNCGRSLAGPIIHSFMAIPELQRKQIERDLQAYCEDVPARNRHQLRYGFTIDGHSVELFEERPRFDKPSEWLRHPIAKFKYVAKTEVWQLYCMFRDLKWHRYEPLPAAGRFGLLFDEVERDLTCIFWG